MNVKPFTLIHMHKREMTCNLTDSLEQILTA